MHKDIKTNIYIIHFHKLKLKSHIYIYEKNDPRIPRYHVTNTYPNINLYSIDNEKCIKKHKWIRNGIVNKTKHTCTMCRKRIKANSIKNGAKAPNAQRMHSSLKYYKVRFIRAGGHAVSLMAFIKPQS